MPHIILKGTGNFAGIHAAFQPSRTEENGWLIKYLDCFFSASGRILIFDTTAVRSGFSQNFYIRAEQKGETVTIRVDPLMRIEKNEGVHRAIAGAARLVLESSPGTAFEKSNLPATILAPASTANE